jgi:hypothetical protein
MDFRTETRILGLLALAFALFGVFAPYRWHEMPPYITLIALIVAGVLGVAAVWEYVRHKFNFRGIITERALVSSLPWIICGLLGIAGAGVVVWRGPFHLYSNNHGIYWPS